MRRRISICEKCCRSRRACGTEETDGWAIVNGKVVDFVFGDPVSDSRPKGSRLLCPKCIRRAFVNTLGSNAVSACRNIMQSLQEGCPAPICHAGEGESAGETETPYPAATLLKGLGE